MATRHSARQTAGRRRAAAGTRAKHSFGRFGYRRSLRFEPLEDRRLLAVVTVDTDQDVVDSNDDVLSLREAIFATNTVPGADTIQFAESLTAEGQATILLTQGELKITDELTIQGPGASQLTIDAQQQSRVFNITATTGDFTFAGLTITGGQTNGTGSSQSGGAVRSLTSGTLTIDQSTVSENSTVGDFADGGAMWTNGDVTLIRSSVSGNSTAGVRANGGGIRANGKVTLSESTVNGNSTTGEIARGGGIMTNGDVTVTQSTVNGNSTTGDNAEGGGIFAVGDIMLTDSTVNGNSTAGFSASGGGFGVLFDVTLIRSSVSGNSTAGDSARGGGIITNGKVTLTESTVSGNSTAGDDAHGGGIMTNGDVILTQSTVSGNSTAGDRANGGGIWALRGLTLDHTILAGNTAGAGWPDLRIENLGPFSTRSVDYSLIGDKAGTGLAEAPVGLPDANGNLIGGPIYGVIDPLLADLADNGGPTMTHALLADSPAINAGDLNVVAGVDGVPEFDQRGEPFGRVVGGRIDIGAVESQSPTDLNLLVDTLVDESDGDYSRGDLSLREAIQLANSNNYEGVVDTIRFDPALSGGTILLTEGELKITDDLTINGRGAELLTIDASGSHGPDGLVQNRVFVVNDGDESFDDNGTYIDVAISGLTITGGNHRAYIGGAISNWENLWLERSVITGNVGSGGIVSLFGSIHISDCLISNNSSYLYGGGIHLSVGSSASSTIVNTTITGNEAIYGGGIRAVVSGSLEINDCTISDNLVHFQPYFSRGPAGGGIHLRVGGTAIVTRTSITDNVLIADDSPYGMSPGLNAGGGGIFVRSYGDARIVDCEITGNSSTLRGGGIFGFGNPLVDNSKLIIDQTIIANNSVDSLRQFLRTGGGAQLSDNVWLTRSVIAGNTASDQGGGVFTNGGLTIADSLIEENEAGRFGGGVYVTGQLRPFTLSGSTVYDNTAESGGGLFLSGSGGGLISISQSSISNNDAVVGGGIFNTSYATRVEYSTIAFNDASSVGGGIYVEDGPLELHHTIAARNSNRFGGDIIVQTGESVEPHYSLIWNRSGSGLAEAPVGSPDENGNIIGDGYFGLINSPVDLLADNGGFTLPDGRTIPTHVLLPDSPAIDAGDPDAMPGEGGVPVFDQRGEPFTRVYGGQIDIGAFEWQPPGVLLGDYNQDGIVDAADYVVWRDEMNAVAADDVLDDLYADGNGDGAVNEWDYQLWRGNFGSVLADVVVSGGGAIAPPSAIVIEKAAPLPQLQPTPAEPSAVTLQRSGPAISRRVDTTVAVRQDQLLSAWVASRLRGESRWDQDNTLVRGRRQGGEDDGAGAHASAVDRVFRGIGGREDLPLAGLRRGQR